MALKATVYKAELQIADMDRAYYQTHNLTLARHPSETEERLMLRLVAFALHASDNLALTKGISADDEPDLWEKNLSGDVACWIELGLPDEKRIRQACGRAERVVIYAYGARSADIWWRQIQSKLSRHTHLTVVHVMPETLLALPPLLQRNMQLQCTVQDGHASLGDGQHHVDLAMERWLPAP